MSKSATSPVSLNYCAWKGRPFPTQAQRLHLPNGKPLEDAIIWPNFCQEELGIDPDEVWNGLLAMPTWPTNKPIQFRERGDRPHWIPGEHAALNYRGHILRRRKIWCQTNYADGLRRYGYTGWQHKISYATHDIAHVPPIKRVANAINAGLSESRHPPYNHWIATAYDDQDDEIGFHSDKDKDFVDNTYFVVVKFGAPRHFAFRMPGEKKPFYSEPLDAGTAVFVRCAHTRYGRPASEHQQPVPSP